MGSFANQLRQILRRLGRSPMFTAITLITLAIGIGANTAIFSVVDGVLLKPLPYPHPEQLVGLWHTAPGLNLPDLEMSPANYFIYREQSRVFEDIGLYMGGSNSVTGLAEPEHVHAIDVTDGALQVLGAQPLLGRQFNRADGVSGSPLTVILGYRYWQRRFGSDNSAIGRMIAIDGQPHQIIGVMPRNFHFLDYEDPELFLPIQFDRNKLFLGNFSYDGIARLKPGVTLAHANADVARMLPIVLRTFAPPQGYSLELFQQARIGPNLRSLTRVVVGDIGGSLWILMGSIGIVLLIACANVANLLLVRAEGRRQELAVRAALGASWRRIAGELLFESILLGLLGSVLGLAFAYGALRLLVALAPHGLPRLQEIAINPAVLLFTLVVSLFASLLSASIPILKYASVHAGTGLRQGGRTTTQGRERHRARNVLVIVQVGLAFVLLICSGLMIRTFRALTRVDPGFTSPDEVQTFRLSIPESEVRDPEAVVRMEQAIQAKLAAVPGVASVAMTNGAPMDSDHWNDPVYAKDHDYTGGKVPPLRPFKFASPGLFKTLGTPLVAGRDFTWSDTYQRLPVAIVSENFAREYWGGPENALGKQIRISTADVWREIVGVARDVHDDGTNVAAPVLVYWPLFMDHFGTNPVEIRRVLAYVIRSSRSGTSSLIKDASEAVWSVDANLPLAEVHTLGYFYNRSMARTSFTLVMLGIAGAAGLLLGIVGLYSVIAYSVAQRRKEIGIRMALGARQDALIRMFVRQGLLLTALGIACGLVAAAGLTRLMASLLFHVSPTDPLTYSAVSIGLIATAVLASYLPSRRAAMVDPVETLRAE